MNPRIVRLTLSVFAFLLAFLTVLRLYPKKEPPKHEPEATHALEALRWYNDQRAYPSGSIPADWREKALAQIGRNGIMKSSSVSSVTWNPVGPTAIGGRVRSIVV